MIHFIHRLFLLLSILVCMPLLFLCFWLFGGLGEAVHNIKIVFKDLLE